MKLVTRQCPYCRVIFHTDRNHVECRRCGVLKKALNETRTPVLVKLLKDTHSYLLKDELYGQKG